MQLANMLGEADKPQDMLVIKFQMDRETLHESVLTITFLKRQARGTNYTLSMKDFMARREERNN
jgi:hypothetical protein